jgi:hypothetical protein
MALLVHRLQPCLLFMALERLQTIVIILLLLEVNASCHSFGASTQSSYCASMKFLGPKKDEVQLFLIANKEFSQIDGDRG